MSSTTLGGGKYRIVLVKDYSKIIIYKGNNSTSHNNPIVDKVYSKNEVYENLDDILQPIIFQMDERLAKGRQQEEEEQEDTSCGVKGMTGLISHLDINRIIESENREKQEHSNKVSLRNEIYGTNCHELNESQLKKINNNFPLEAYSLETGRMKNLGRLQTIEGMDASCMKWDKEYDVLCLKRFNDLDFESPVSGCVHYLRLLSLEFNPIEEIINGWFSMAIRLNEFIFCGSGKQKAAAKLDMSSKMLDYIKKRFVKGFTNLGDYVQKRSDIEIQMNNSTKTYEIFCGLRSVWKTSNLADDTIIYLVSVSRACTIRRLSEMDNSV